MNESRFRKKYEGRIGLFRKRKECGREEEGQEGSERKDEIQVQDPPCGNRELEICIVESRSDLFGHAENALVYFSPRMHR
ncbi:hypothetical protein U0070_010404 [Myodes glareolus]|uniref:Uncharacterized protein n=1 Tax=Myodes glareolus TaxID=447135 RepID=A0AAW0I739_MYOGA